MKKYTLWIILGAIGLVALYGVSVRNNFVTMEETVNQKWAQVDNQLKRRYDLIPNLVNTIKGLTKHEDEVFGHIADARARLAGAKTPNDTMQASQQMESSLSRLLVITENYPQLRSSETFTRLMDELAGSENRIAVERQRYNESIQTYNKSLRIFPGSLIAGMMGLDKKSYFETKVEEKESPKVDFN